MIPHRAGRIKQDAIEATHELWELAAVCVEHDRVTHAEARQVGLQRFDAILVGVVGNERTCPAACHGASGVTAVVAHLMGTACT